MLKFVLLVNKQGQTRLSQYYEYVAVEERVTTEADIVRKCLARSEDSVSKTGRGTVQYIMGVLILQSVRRDHLLRQEINLLIVRPTMTNILDLLLPFWTHL